MGKVEVDSSNEMFGGIGQLIAHEKRISGEIRVRFCQCSK